MKKRTTYSSEVDQSYKIDKGRKRPKYRQGLYKPTNPQKCINVSEGKPVEFRSNLEFEYMYRVDRSPIIESWGSEVIWIPYYNPVKKRVCQYWVDLILNTKDHGILLVEIKPQKEITAIHEGKIPKMTARKKKKTFAYEMEMYHINQAKWIAAKEFAQTKGWKFIQLSEKHIKGHIPFI